MHLSYLFFCHLCFEFSSYKLPSLQITESGNCCGPIDYHVGPGGGDRLFQALHVAGHFNHDQKAPKIQTRGVLLPGPTGLRDLDVHRVCLYRRERGALPGQPLQPVWMAHRGARRGHRWSAKWPAPQWVWYLQLPLVFPWCLHAAGLWHLSQVRHFHSIVK